MKKFNTTGVCIPEKHYMVDLSERMKQIKVMIDAGQYFTINRARQYGKTTTLNALTRYLKNEYVILSLDFQGFDAEDYQSAGTFTQALAQMIIDENEFNNMQLPEQYLKAFHEIYQKETKTVRMADIFRIFKRWCSSSEKPVLLMIDEVDSAVNNQVFLDFLAQLRDGYIGRDTKGMPAFHSVILAGVTDVKNMKRKLRPEEERKLNSPWNIATEFKLDMSLSTDGIAGMLTEYEKDHHTGMDIQLIAEEICKYTNGYPFLVSRICQLIDTQLAGNRFSDITSAWTIQGVSEAVRQILMEKNSLFESLMGKVYYNSEMSSILKRILFAGDIISYNPDNLPVMDAEMYGFIRNECGNVVIANRIFETRLYNYYLSAFEMLENPMYKMGTKSKEGLIQNGHLLMSDVMERYMMVFDELYGDQSQPFDEAEGRRRFLLFIRPIINGTGNYYIEAQTRNNERMDLVIDYLGERHVIELKIWHGKAYHERGEKQLAAYLDYYHTDKGYLLTYNFNKKKTTGIRHVMVEGKEIVEVMV